MQRLLISLLLLASLPLLASQSWEGRPALPDEHGFAGGYAGTSGGALIFAGGANFPDAAPWEGGRKKWHRQIFVLADEKATAWKRAGELPEEMAYGVSVSLDDAVICIGGGNAVEHTREVFALRWDGARVKRETLPSLPAALAFHAGAVVDGSIHVIGGISEPSAVEASGRHFAWTPGDEAWRELPALPAAGRMLAVAGSRSGSFYVFSGASLAADEEGKPQRTYLNDAWVFTKDEEWVRLADLPRPCVAAPSPAPAVGASHFLIIGGDDGSKAGFSPLSEHPGFPADILAYNTLTDRWSAGGELPGEIPSPVTTPVVEWGGSFVLPSGEIRPGVRTPGVSSLVVEPTRSAFGAFNWTVVVLYLGGMIGIGIFFMKREASASTEAYFRGGQRVPPWVAGLSIFATMLSALTFMGIPARVYQTDMSWYLGQLPILIIVPIVASFYLPFFRKLDLTSAYEYLEKRFSLACRLFASVSFMAFHLGRIAIVLYLPALALATVSEIDVVSAVLVVGVLCLIYTVIGGIEAVVWTDAIQAMVLLGGALLCAVVSVSRVDGGLGAIVRTASEDEKLFETLKWTDFDIGDGTTSAVVLFVAFFFNSFVPYTSGQDIVQRYVTTPDLKAAKHSLKVTMWMSVFGSLLFFLLGAAVYGFYQAKPAALEPGLPAVDSILPFFIVRELPVGISGLVIAAIFAASQSTVSSSLNSVATAFSKDIDSRLLRKSASDKSYLRAAQGVVVVAGIIGISIAVIMAKSDIESAFKSFNTMIGLTAGALGGLFALGVFSRRANSRGGLLGALLAVSVVLTLHLGEFPVSGLLYAAIGFATCYMAGYLFSLLLPGAGDTSLSILNPKK